MSVKTKVIIDSDRTNEHIIRHWNKDFKQIEFEVFIKANYSIYHLEVLIEILQREIKNAREELKKAKEAKQ